MQVIITGATGFVGTNLSVYLSETKIDVLPLSLRNYIGLRGNAQAVIHLAGKAHDTSNTSSADQYFAINRDLTIKLFDDFLKTEIRDFIYFSSVKACADSLEGVLDEEQKPMPETPYGKSKLEAEQYLLNQKLPSNKRLFIIRPCMIHGPGNKGNLNLLYKFVEKGIPYPLAAFENKRSFLSIDNLNYLISEILSNANIKSGIYNFADDGVLSTNELVVLIAKILSRKEKLWKIPSRLIFLIARLGDLLKFPLNTERLKKLTENYVVSNHKIKKALNIEHLPVSAKKGLEKTIKSFK